MPEPTSPKLPAKETDEDNVGRQEQSQGDVRPDGPGDETSPVKPDHTQRRPRGRDQT